MRRDPVRTADELLTAIGVEDPTVEVRAVAVRAATVLNLIEAAIAQK